MGGSSTTKQENKPPAYAQPLFERGAEEAMNLFESGTGGQTYLGSTVAPLSDTSMQGVNQLANAGQNWDTAGTRGLFAQIGAASAGPSNADRYITDIASGATNPYFEERLENQLDKTASQVNSYMSGAGRYGSGAHTGTLTNELGGLRTDSLFNQFNQDIQNRMAATGQLDAARNAGLNRSLQATDAMSGLDQRNFQNRLAGAGATLEAGNILDTQSQRQLNDEINKFYALDNQDWTRLGMLQSAASGAAGPYGTSIAQSRQSPGLGGILGGVGSLFSGK